MAAYYFAYGSNMNRARVEKRQMAFTNIEPGILHNYRLAFNKRSVKIPGAGSANVIESTGDVVEGVLYQLQSETQIRAMDPFEGYPIRYDRFLLPIATREAEKEAWVYIANESHVADGLKPASWYLKHLLAGREHLSDPYYSALLDTSCLPDSDQEPL